MHSRVFSFRLGAATIFLQDCQARHTKTSEKMASKFFFSHPTILTEKLWTAQSLASHRKLPQIEMEIQILCRKFILYDINKLVPYSFLKCFVPG